MINPETIQLTELPSVPLTDRSQLPRQPAIYFAIDSEGQVQYIGKSVDPRQRWATHHHYQELSQQDGVRIAYLNCDPVLLDEVELALIQWFEPPLNVMGIHAKMSALSRKEREFQQKAVTYRFDERLIDAVKDCARDENSSANNWMETLLIKVLKERGRIPDTFRPLGETRVGDRTKPNEAEVDDDQSSAIKKNP